MTKLEIKEVPFTVKRNDWRRLVDQVANGFRTAIYNGYYQAGDALPSRAELARLLGVSERIPRMAMAQLAEEGLVVQRPGAGCRVLPSAHPDFYGHVLYITPEEDGSFYLNVFAGTMQRKLRESHWMFSKLTFHKLDDGRFDISESDISIYKPIDFAILHYTVAQYSDFERWFASLGIPYVMFGYGLKGDFENRVGLVPYDLSGAIAEFRRHCVSRKVERVLQIGGGRGSRTDAATVLRNVDIGVECLYPHIASNAMVDAYIRAGIDSLIARMKSRQGKDPQLVYIADDWLAIGALQALSCLRIRIPEDMTLVSYSNLGLGPVFVRSLTRIEVDPIEDGTRAASAVLEYLKSGRSFEMKAFSGRYVVGQTFP